MLRLSAPGSRARDCFGFAGWRGVLTLTMVFLAGCGAIQNTVIPGVGHVRFGMASWYGDEFHGSNTASGEEYDMSKLTAAHRTLPFGTLIHVRNIENSRGVIVRINDRGPLKQERIIDLSFAAAKKIHMLDGGVARVRLEIIDEKTGLASWYGKRYHGKKTASGELFDMNQLTAAHKTLPFGTTVRVTNVENGKDVTLRINDRVPSSHKTLINVSRQAAEKLDMLKSGTARVIVDVVKPENASKN